MADKNKDYLKLKNGDKIHFIPPSPSGTDLGGVSVAEKTAWDLVINWIAPEYDTTTAYYQYDLVRYNGSTYGCEQDGTTGAWDASKWYALSDLNTYLTWRSLA